MFVFLSSQKHIPHQPQGARFILTVHSVSVRNALIQHVMYEGETANVWQPTSSALVQIRSGRATQEAAENTM